jgi:hypothetical protein
LESRWEALEALEALVASGSSAGNALPSPRLVAETAALSLFAAGPLEIIRVGGSAGFQEAPWRYGGLPGRGRGPLWGLRNFLRRRRLGELAWKGRRSCLGCGYEFTELSFWDRKILILTPEDADESRRSGIGSLSLSRRCPRCRDAHAGGLHMSGVEADFAIARIMAYERPSGCAEEGVRGALRIIEDAGGPAALLRLLTRHGRPLGDLPAVGSVALEILGDAAKERALLKLELASLEARWREEEELASLVDGELTPFPALRGLGRR